MGDVIISRSRTNKVKKLVDLEKAELDELIDSDSDKEDSESVMFTDDNDELTISMGNLIDNKSV